MKECKGEIVGLFKFSPNGRKVFCRSFKEMIEDKNEINIEGWPNISKAVSGRVSIDSLHADEKSA